MQCSVGLCNYSEGAHSDMNHFHGEEKATIFVSIHLLLEIEYLYLILTFSREPSPHVISIAIAILLQTFPIYERNAHIRRKSFKKLKN